MLLLPGSPVLPESPVLPGSAVIPESPVQMALPQLQVRLVFYTF